MRYIIILILVYCASTNAQDLRRKALIGAWGKADSAGLTVDTIFPVSTALAAGIKKSDRIISINNQPVKDLASLSKIASGIREKDQVLFTIMPAGKDKPKTIKVKAAPKPVEQNPYAKVTYDWIKTRDCYTRFILYTPETKTPPPVILLIPGYNCGSIENFANSYNGILRNEWLKAGYAVACVEKSGVGDSYGCKPCIEATLAEDIDIYSATCEHLKKLAAIDTGKIVLWGHSMGGLIVPVLAEKYKPAAVMVFATVFRPWNEFLLEMHRVQAPLDGKSYEETEDFVRTMHRIYYEFFILKKTPAQIRENPDLKALVDSELEYKPGSTQQWGRHWHFWQQIDSLNLAASWSRVTCPVLSVFGGSDFIQCSAIEHDLICETVNRQHPGYASNIVIPDIDHLMSTEVSREASHEHFKEPGYMLKKFNYRLPQETISWLKRMI